LRLAALAIIATLAGGAPAVAATTPGVVNQPVSFVVQNVNKSSVPCGTDGKTYTIRGHLTGPASSLSRPTPGTLYLHGLELGEWFWQVPVTGYNHAVEMAKRGHVSVTIDRLGYGGSDHPNGTKSCVGGQATIAHQIVQQLRAGTYAGTLHPRFSRVALAGHSLGGSIAQVEAYSFTDVDAVAILSYADVGLTPATLFTAVAWGPVCLRTDDSYFTASQADYRKNFLAAAPEPVFAYADRNRSLNPCGDLQSAVPAAVVSLLRANQVKVPVLLLMGDKDLVFDSARLPLQAALYGGPTTTKVIAGATHGLTVDRTAGQFRSALEGWLISRGF
jgi:pimeloyl-ACP methyl ester carboxylesterase